MNFSKKVASLGIALALVSCLGVTTALGTNEANDSLAMSNVVDKSAGENLEYAGVAESGVAVSVTAPEGAFSDGAEMSVSDVVVPQEDLEEVVAAEASGDILGLSAVDISFEGEQPSEAVSVNIEVPASEVPEGANIAVIVHMAGNGPEVVGTASLDSSASKHSLSFSTDGFSSYVAVFVNGKYSSQKMSDVLASDPAYSSRYSIEAFDVDLFDYEPYGINESLDKATTDGNGFHFTGYGVPGKGSNTGINNSTAATAKQGILQDALVGGLPVVNHLEGENAGTDTGKILFSDDYEATGKTIYKDIPFEFVYDNHTGYYEYKSSANHAQVNTLADGSKKVELYADTLSTQNNSFGFDQPAGNISLSSYTFTHKVTVDAGATADHLSATASRGSSTERLDAQIRYENLSVDPLDVNKLCLKMKAPADLGDNKLYVFFKGEQTVDGVTTTPDYAGGNSVSVAYTPNGDWIEFELDMSTNANWAKFDVITGLRVDPFDITANTHTLNTFDFELSDFDLFTANTSTLDLSLGAENKAAVTVDRSKTTASHLYATAFRESDSARCDAYINYSNLAIDPSEADKLYLKVKVPSEVGNNAFKVYFSGSDAAGVAKDYHEDRTYKIPYTPKDDWVEFVIDTSENPEWEALSVVTGLRVDFFDSECTATGEKYNVPAGTYDIEMSEFNYITEVPATNTTSYAHYGGFYPFTDIADSYPGNSEPFNLSTWAHLQQADGIATVTATRSMGNPSLSNSQLYEELAFGMVMEFDFYIPVDKQGMDEKDLIYYFNGDDDLWVFVDDKLVLDIGGGHGAITGTANFTNGAVTVASAVTVDGYNTGATADDVAEAAPKNTIMEPSLLTPGKHTMKVFYLERCGSVSNCYMKFNLPQTPEGDVSVSKSAPGVDATVLAGESFEFSMTAKDLGSGSTTGGTAVAWANKNYFLVDTATGTVVENDSSPDGSFATSAEGKFELKAGQEALFTFSENYEVTVTETQKDIAGHEHISTKVNGHLGVSGSPLYSLTQFTADGEKKQFAFENAYKELPATFTYIPVNPADCPAGQKGTVELTGQPSGATCDSAGINETIGQRVGAPLGSTATATNTVKFIGWYSDPECVTEISADAIINPIKEQGSNLWSDNTYYAKFEYMYGNLTIAKSGISAVDNHAASGDIETSNVEECQSVVFNVKGTSYSGVELDMDVSLHVNADGEGQTIVVDLPVGEYVVTEKTDWTWRYEISSVMDSDKQAANSTDGAAERCDGGYKVIVDDDGNGLTFANTRDNPSYWLSGDNWCRNLFKDAVIQKVTQQWAASKAL